MKRYTIEYMELEPEVGEPEWMEAADTNDNDEAYGVARDYYCAGVTLVRIYDYVTDNFLPF